MHVGREVQIRSFLRRGPSSTALSPTRPTANWLFMDFLQQLSVATNFTNSILKSKPDEAVLRHPSWPRCETLTWGLLTHKQKPTWSNESEAHMGHSQAHGTDKFIRKTHAQQQAVRAHVSWINTSVWVCYGANLSLFAAPACLCSGQQICFCFSFWWIKGTQVTVPQDCWDHRRTTQTHTFHFTVVLTKPRCADSGFLLWSLQEEYCSSLQLKYEAQKDSFSTAADLFGAIKHFNKAQRQGHFDPKCLISANFDSMTVQPLVKQKLHWTL